MFTADIRVETKGENTFFVILALRKWKQSDCPN